MNFKFKTLLVLSGTALLTIPGLQAQRAGGGSRGGFSGGRGGFAGAGGRPSFAARPAASLSSGGALRGSRFTNTRPTRSGYYGGRGGSYYRGNGHGHHYGRYYYLGGIPYFYPFYGYGFGYPYYYGSGFYGPYGYGGAYLDGSYDGRIYDRDRDRDDDDESDRGGAAVPAPANGQSLTAAVQRQLSKRGYYRGRVDGQFGPASRDALSRFQKSQDLKTTGRIDENTLEALGFTDER